ncbi:MAG TPA: hypothetical protein VGD62_11655 [Acidobacteriaceae bacterium]
MAKKSKQPSFDEILNALRGYKFDVDSSLSVAKPAPGRELVRVSKYGCAALIAPASGSVGKAPAGGSGAITAQGRGTATGKGPAEGPNAPVVAIVGRAGIVLDGETGHILDKGYQKFVKTAHAEVPATAEQLRALHRFSEELRQATGNVSLYNESLGTVSDEYLYDRVKGRDLPVSERAKPAWSVPGETT